MAFVGFCAERVAVSKTHHAELLMNLLLEGVQSTPSSARTHMATTARDSIVGPEPQRYLDEREVRITSDGNEKKQSRARGPSCV